MTFENLIEDLIKYWKERQVSCENIAEKTETLIKGTMRNTRTKQ